MSQVSRNSGRSPDSRAVLRTSVMCIVMLIALLAGGLGMLILCSISTLVLVGLVLLTVFTRRAPGSSGTDVDNQSPWSRLPGWLIAVLALFCLVLASHIRVPGEPISPLMAFIAAMAGCAFLLILLLSMILWTVLPGRKVRARIIGKETIEVQFIEGDAPVPVRHVTMEFSGQEFRFQVDMWDYNRMGVGDEGILEYKKNEFHSFTKSH